MANGPGYIQLQRALGSIRVGRRHRTELGDIDALAASIEENGVFQIITIDPDGTLVCGLRRLAAMRQLGWKTADVWVRPGISDQLGQLLAEQDDNALHKPLTLTEQATLYRELKTLMAEDAARRQEASRFVAGGPNPRSHGAATVAAPSTDPGPAGSGDSRAQAALMVTGRASYTSMERIGELQRLAEDESQPAVVRERAAAELAGIDAGASITAAHQRIRAEVSLAELDRLAADSSLPEEVRADAARDAAELRSVEAQTRAAELESLAAEALARVRAEGGGKKRGKRTRPATTPAVPAGVMTVRAFVLTWDELALWWQRCDPSEVGPALSEEEWQRFEQTVAGTAAFAQAADAARRQARLHAV